MASELLCRAARNICCKVVLTYFTFAVKVRVVAFLETYRFPPHPRELDVLIRKFF
jgi:hypothetical protein